MNDQVKTKWLLVEVQENLIVRDKNGKYLGRFEKEDVVYDELVDEKPNEAENGG